ncbi:hypothetical protein ACFE04_010706 [Oxalis oulophora]
MDCYYGNGTIDDFCVSKDQEMLDRLPSPGSWSHWGMTSSEDFAPSNEESMAQLDYNGDQFYDEVEMPTSNSCGGLLDESSQQTSNSCDGRSSSAYQFRVDEMDDDNYLNLLMNNSENEDLYRSFCLSPEFPVVPSDDQSMDTILNSESISGKNHSVRTQKHHKTSAYSQSSSWGCDEASASRSSSLYFEQKECPPGKENISVPSEYNISKGPGCDERTFEESVLLELESVMAKLTDKTRISFRDGFYRLAKSSKRTAVNENGDFSEELPSPSQRNHDEQLSYEKQQATESETNTFDRAIANLMFNKMDINMAEFPPMVESHNCSSKHEATESNRENYGSASDQHTYYLSNFARNM